MKEITFACLLILSLQNRLQAQEKYGKALNLGVGIGYYGLGSSPAFHLNYEFDLFKNFTLTPFLTVQSRRTYYYDYDKVNGNYRNYYYRDTYVPLGAKGTYYFDELLEATDKWDFWAAVSLGFAIRNRNWEDETYTNTTMSSPSPIYSSLHIGTEVHLNAKAGLFLDISTGLSTFGVAVHF